MRIKVTSQWRLTVAAKRACRSDTPWRTTSRKGWCRQRAANVSNWLTRTHRDVFPGCHRFLVVTLPNINGQVFGNQQTCTHTYVVSADGSFTLQGNCSGTQTAGPNIGGALSTTGIKLKGQIGTRRRTLIFFGDGANIETFQFDANPLRQQICSQTGTAVRI